MDFESDHLNRTGLDTIFQWYVVQYYIYTPRVLCYDRFFNEALAATDKVQVTIGPGPTHWSQFVLKIVGTWMDVSIMK